MTVDELLFPLHSPRLVRVNAIADDGLNVWLRSANYVPNIVAGKLVASSFDMDELLASWGHDAARLLVAGRESIRAIGRADNRPRSTAWPLIKAYYAAFYYAHVVLRLTRTSLTYTPTTSLLKLDQLVDVYGLVSPFRLRTNQYIFAYSEVPPELQIEQKAGGEGTHENTWKQLENLVNNCRLQSINAPNADVAEIDRVLGILSSAIYMTEQPGKMLSTVRNEIQYTQLHGVWPPYGSTLRADYCARRVLQLDSRDTKIEDFDIYSGDLATRFLNCCMLICWVSECFLNRISSRHSKSFLNANYARR